MRQSRAVEGLGSPRARRPPAGSALNPRLSSGCCAILAYTRAPEQKKNFPTTPCLRHTLVSRARWGLAPAALPAQAALSIRRRSMQKRGTACASRPRFASGAGRAAVRPRGLASRRSVTRPIGQKASFSAGLRSTPG